MKPIIFFITLVASAVCLGGMSPGDNDRACTPPPYDLHIYCTTSKPQRGLPPPTLRQIRDGYYPDVIVDIRWTGVDADVLNDVTFTCDIPQLGRSYMSKPTSAASDQAVNEARSHVYVQAPRCPEYGGIVFHANPI